MSAKAAIRNRTGAELEVGDSASLERSCSVQDLFLFAHVSGNVSAPATSAVDTHDVYGELAERARAFPHRPIPSPP